MGNASREGETNLVPQDVPKVLFLQMQTPMKKAYPNLPAQWFPMTPVPKYWCLDSDECIDICRRGYPLVPNFSTAIDAATGQTLKKVQIMDGQVSATSAVQSWSVSPATLLTISARVVTTMFVFSGKPLLPTRTAFRAVGVSLPAVPP